MNRVAFGLMGAVALLATPAFAVSDNVPVNVSIEVAPNVSVWTNNDNDIETVALVLNGQDGNNFDGHASTVQVMTNVAAQLQVSAASTISSSTGGEGIWFYLFPNQNNVAAAQAAAMSNAYAPADALVWAPHDQPPGANQYGHSYTIGPFSPATSVQNLNVVYAAATPGDLPLPITENVTVTYTITSVF